jgi:hypothetical protein
VTGVAILLCSVLQRDMAERGHNLGSIKASMDARKPDLDAYMGNQITKCQYQQFQRICCKPDFDTYLLLPYRP